MSREFRPIEFSRRVVVFAEIKTKHKVPRLRMLLASLESCFARDDSFGMIEV